MQVFNDSSGIIASLQGTSTAAACPSHREEECATDAYLAAEGGFGVIVSHLLPAAQGEVLGAVAGVISDARILGDAFGDLAAVISGLASGDQNVLNSAVNDLNCLSTFKLVKAGSDLIKLTPVGKLLLLKGVATTLNLIDVENEFFNDGSENNACSTGVNTGKQYPNPFPSPDQGIGFITGNAVITNSQGLAAAQSGLDLCCFGASGLGIVGVADPGGNYSLPVPLQVPGTDYTSLFAEVFDPVSGIMLTFETVDLSGLNTSAPVQVPPMAATCNDTDSGNPDGDDPDCD
jgi:hypothetical protein